jgi:NAD(P)-dependent dehydrogenase (short-subunit alcohol dehydrogenase family)
MLYLILIDPKELNMDTPEKKNPTPPFPPQYQSPPGVEEEMNPKPRSAAVDYRPADKLSGKVALVTGGDSGIGRATARLFAREGADVAIVYLPEEEKDGRATEELIQEEGRRCLRICGDVRESSFCKEAVRRTVDAFGRLDILVNNAAYQHHLDHVDALSEEQWDRTFKTNIYGYFYMMKAALPHLKEGAVIINTGSITGMEGSGGLIDYSSTKGAIHTFTKSLAKQLFDRGIRVNCVAPGPVWTPLNPAERPPDEVRNFGAGIPAGRPAQPDELAPVYVFLASNADSGFITGEVLPVLGGETVAG